MNRRICIITGTRAEYGLLHRLMREIQEDPGIDLQIIATGMHLSPEFGLTYEQIEEDGFVIDETVEMLLSSDTPVGIAKSMGVGTIGFADALNRLDPNIVVLLGDRFEILAAAQAAMVARIPIAHVGGGEATEGAVDESIRHAVSKMSHYHFVATEIFRKRVIQLGEAPDRVFDVGALGLDYLYRISPLGRDAFEQSIDFQLGDPTFLITYHPATLQSASPVTSLEELLQALGASPKARFIFTKSNADAAGRAINHRIEDFVDAHPDQACVFTSLGQHRYVSALHHVDVVLGNSSSGIIEAPAIPVPTVNVGTRQQGRLRVSSIIDCEEDANAIAEAIETALSSSFRRKIEDVTSPYGDGRAVPRIRRHLKRIDFNEPIKPFYDLSEYVDG